MILAVTPEYFVSLFTREWIEIRMLALPLRLHRVSLFTREWIEIIDRTGRKSPKSVSLFTREWIEISDLQGLRLHQLAVSLFTREWIEINTVASRLDNHVSPSLRGSGLKLGSFYHLNFWAVVSLFTREWIEIVSHCQTGECCTASPSLRGSGLK